MTEDVGTTPRRALTPTQRLKLFEAHQGRCCICSERIEAGDKWIDEHLRALGLGGTNEWDNRGPAHVSCAAVKTKDDVRSIAKAKRMKMAHVGIKRRGNPMPGSKASGWRKRMDGTVERRT